MKKKKFLYIVLGIVAVFGVLLLTDTILNSANSRNITRYCACMDAGDLDGAAKYANKLKNDEYLAEVEDLRRMRVLCESGSFAEAAALYESASCNDSVWEYPIALYCHCRYMLSVPAAEEALQKGNNIEALQLLFDFQNTFHDGGGNTTIYDDETGHLQVGEYYYFSEAYPEEADRFFTLFCTAGDAALQSGDAEACALLETVLEDEWPRTYRAADFSWAEGLKQRQKEQSDAHQALVAADKARIIPNFDPALLKNWTPKALKPYGASDITSLHPTDPQPMHYIIVAEEPINPLTGEVSEGGLYETGHGYGRVTYPASVQDLLEHGGIIENSGLTLTDDPNRASFALLLRIEYTRYLDSVSSGEDTLTFTSYYCTLHAELLDLVSGKTLEAAELTEDPFYQNGLDINEYIDSRYVEAAKDSQLFCSIPTLSAEDFSGYWDFVGQPEPVLD